MRTACSFLLAACAFVVFGCRSGEEKREAAVTDSLSLRLNSPELKNINSQILHDAANPDLYLKRSKIYLSLKEPAAAINDAKRALRLDSMNSVYYMALADAYFAKNESRNARDVLMSVDKRFPENTEAKLKLAEIFYLVQNYQKAIDYINSALRIDEHLARAYYLKGTVYRESGDTAKAVSSLETAVEQDNTFADAFYDLGIIYAARKNPLALQYYDNVQRIQPGREDVQYARAKLLQDLGKADEAIAAYTAITASRKDCADCYYNLGAIFLEIKKDPPKAIDYFSQAINAAPEYYQAYFARGVAFVRKHDTRRAREDFNACLRIHPNFEPAVEGINSLK